MFATACITNNLSGGDVGVAGQCIIVADRMRLPTIARWLVAVSATLVAFALPSLPLPNSFLEWLDNLTGLSPTGVWVLLSTVQPLLALSIIFGTVLLVEGEALSFLNLRRPAIRDLLAIPILIVLMAFGSIGVRHLARSINIESSVENQFLVAAQSVSSLHVWAQALTVVLYGLVEEIGWRAYTLERFAKLFGSIAPAVCISFVLSLLAHAPFWGLGYMLWAAPEQALFLAFYLYRRNATSSVIAHFVVNAIAYIWIQ